MTTDPIPKTIPRSTLACPPAKNFTDQYLKSSTAMGKPTKDDKERGVNDSGDKNLKASQQGSKNNFASTQSNFRSSSKDFKQSTKNLPPSSSNFQSTQNLQKKSTDNPKTEKVNNYSHSEIHVKKWVDYSTKYGLGYLLSDGSTGVYFNDSTKIIVDRNGENF